MKNFTLLRRAGWTILLCGALFLIVPRFLGAALPDAATRLLGIAIIIALPVYAFAAIRSLSAK